RSSCSPTSPTRPATPSTGASATAPWKTARCSPSPPPRLDASASRRPPPTARAAGRGGLLDAGLLHVAEFALELLDLVAEAGGELELEVGGGLVHLLGHLLDEALQLLAGPLADQVGGVAADLPGAGRETRDGRLAAALLPPGPADEGLGVGVLPDEGVEDVGDPLAERLRFDAVLLVVRLLLGAAAVGLVDRALHRRGDCVGVHVDLAGHVAGRAADRLDEGRLGAQEALLVGVEDRDERHLGQVEALAEQVDADQHVELAGAQLPQQLDAP